MEIKNSSILIKNIRLVFRCSLQKSIQFSTITTVNNYVALIILLLTEQFCKVTDLLNCLTLLSHRESFHDWLREKKQSRCLESTRYSGAAQSLRVSRSCPSPIRGREGHELGHSRTNKKRR